MDDSVRAEYQRRLAAGDQAGALAYLRMLRTQTSDPAARDAFNQAIAEIEGGAGTAAGAVDSSYGGSAGPFGDNADQWAAEHTRHHSSTASAPTPSAPPAPSYGGSPSYPGTSAGVDLPPVREAGPSGPVDAGHAASNPPAAQEHASPAEAAGRTIGGILSGALGLGGQVGGAIGDTVEHALENLPGHGQSHSQTAEPKQGAQESGQGRDDSSTV